MPHDLRSTSIYFRELAGIRKARSFGNSAIAGVPIFAGRSTVILPQIRVSTIRLSNVPEWIWPALDEVLSKEEKSRALKFHLLRNQREYVSAHALTRVLIGASRGGDGCDLTIGTGEFGKPFILDGKGPHFSLSHCDGLVACATSHDLNIGLDVESSTHEAYLDIAQRFFTPTENAELMALPAAARPARFRQLWTIKEAFIKATGAGLSQPLDSFSIQFDPSRIGFPDSGSDSKFSEKNWHFYHQAITKHHTLAIAWQGMTADIIVEEGNLPYLISRFGPLRAKELFKHLITVVSQVQS